MRFLHAILTVGLTVALFYGLHTKFGQVPPLGKLLDPYHGFWQNAETEQLTYPEHITSPQLNDSVVIHYDDRLVPHIFAQNDHDLYFAQGYVTAQFRLWQMEVQTHAAAGRLAEIIGPAVLPLDRMKRRLGLAETAERTLQKYLADSISKTVIQAYAGGVNAYIRSLDYSRYPVEYKLLDYAPERWTTLKTVLLLKQMALLLAGDETDLANTNALKFLGRDLFNAIYPRFPDTLEPIVPKQRSWDFKADTPKRPPTYLPDRYLSEALHYTQRPSPKGSNNWAIGGSKTANGAPILCNDPHLPLNLPSWWVEMQLQAPGVNTYGVALPGAPGIIIGFNEQVAWGLTNAGRDVKDWYHLSFQTDKKEKYRYGQQWLAVDKHIDTIKVRGQQPFYDTIRYTRLGPIVYDDCFPGDTDQTNMALRWTAHDLSNEGKAIYLLNRAQNYKDYLQAIRHYQCPAQNFAFASRQGDIAIWQQGLFPLKWHEQGRFLLEAGNRLHHWRGFIPQAHNPHVRNPDRGFVSSANQHPTNSTYPYYYNGGFALYRSLRINERLRQDSSITIRDMKQLQNDNYNVQAALVLPFLKQHLYMEQLKSPGRQYYDLLADWDHHNRMESKAAAVFKVWWERFYRLLWDELLQNPHSMPFPGGYNTIRFLEENPQHVLVDNRQTEQKETIADLCNRSFSQAVDTLERWKEKNGEDISWWKYKGTHLAHMGRIAPFGTGKIKIGGDRGIVNAAGDDHGPSWRMIVQLGDTIHAYGVYPGGQSGNPGSPYYTDFVETWAEGDYYRLSFFKDRAAVEDNILLKQTLTHP